MLEEGAAFWGVWSEGLVSSRRWGSPAWKDATGLPQQRAVRGKPLAESGDPHFCPEGTRVLGLSESHGQGRGQGVAEVFLNNKTCPWCSFFHKGGVSGLGNQVGSREPGGRIHHESPDL